MYGWLHRAGGESTHVVTANRRLARLLTDEFSSRQVEAGRLAWRSPTILSVAAWLARLRASDTSLDQATRIDSNQSRLLWEQVLRDHVRNPLVNINSLARDARDSWQSLCDWRIPLEEIAAAAHGADQHVFANAAKDYAALLTERGWLDDALLPAHVSEAVRQGALELPDVALLAGFDRVTPSLGELLEALRERGTTVELQTSPIRSDMQLMAFETADAELRAAGAWAREELDKNPALRVSVVVPQLEREAPRIGRLIRDGFVPGWQYAGSSARDAVNVSYGRRLADYPAVEIAQLMLAWTCRPLDSREISLLLRTPFLGLSPSPGRARMELRLRELPDRRWTISQFLGAVGSGDEAVDRIDWLSRLSQLLDQLRDRPRASTPAYWAETANSILSEMNWPGGAVLDSADFQLADRWRELLNELARLALVVPEITMAEAFSQLGAMASEAVFQPESTESRLQVIGPLEAAGARFDRLWICGLTASQWPPAARPSALISRRLQRRYQMPDADPKDTTEYAQRMLERLLGAAVTCRCSYARMAGDSEQSPTSLLADVSILPAESGPGWHAQDLVALGCATTIADDPVPPVSEDERVRGGAATLQHQLSEPFGAFAYGRLGIRRLESIAAGLGPLVRGNLVHAALFRLYERLPTALELRAWGSAETEQQVAMAIEATFPRYERRADKVLQSLLALERRRVAQLLTSVIDLDRNREEFRVKAVEGIHEFRHGNLSLELRIDRIDRLEDGSVAVLDYKTGTPRRFLNADGDPRDIQLVVYAYSLEDPVSMMGLYNIDSRQTAIEASNAEDTDDWSATLARWFSLVERAAEELAGGDVRLHSRSSVSEARPLSLLTRFGELTRDA